MPVKPDPKEVDKDREPPEQPQEPTEALIAELPVNLIARARALFDKALVCLGDAGLSPEEAAAVAEVWTEDLTAGEADEEDDDEEEDDD